MLAPVPPAPPASPAPTACESSEDSFELITEPTSPPRRTALPWVVMAKAFKGRSERKMRDVQNVETEVLDLEDVSMQEREEIHREVVSWLEPCTGTQKTYCLSERAKLTLDAGGWWYQ